MQIQPGAARNFGANPIALINAHNNIILEHNFIFLNYKTFCRSIRFRAVREDKTSALDKKSGQMLRSSGVVAGFPAAVVCFKWRRQIFV